jgi:predicted Zn-dependent peptidase
VLVKTILPSGLRVVTQDIPQATSVCVAIFVGVGSRYEGDEEGGISHFIEHLCFKGTHKRPHALDISRAIESVGGILNGGTDKELTCYWCKVASKHFAIALDVMSDIVGDPLFNAQDVDKERGVIIEETNMMLDNPRERVSELMDNLLFPHHPLGREIIGSKEVISSLSPQQIVSFFSRHYLQSNIVAGIAGNIPQGTVDEVEKACSGKWGDGYSSSFLSADLSEGGKVKVEKRDIEQAHICLGFPGISLKDEDRFALNLMNTILGEGMSSHLFQSIREDKGLAYDIRSSVDYFVDTGSLVIHAGVSPTSAKGAISAIKDELEKLKDGVQAEELFQAQEKYKGRLALQLEDTQSMAIFLAQQELLLGEVLTPTDIMAQVDLVSPQDIKRMAQRILDLDRMSLACVGPVEEEHFEL